MMKNAKVKLREIIADAPILLSVAMLCLICMAFTGLWPTKENPYNTYSLQAQAWLDGHLDLGRDYPWLELAVYDGKYYVSFPPFPSFVLLPFCLIFGSNTPDHWIMLFLTAISTIYALKLYREIRNDRKHENLWVIFLLAGNGYLNISLQGWVWHIAQVMCFALSLMSIYYAIIGKGGLSLGCWASAVGCRPMVVVYFPFLAYLLCKRSKNRKKRMNEWVIEHWSWSITPILLAASYMLLNYARFKNPLEFGHNYLPEFTRSEMGQFNIGYLGKNLGELFRIPEIDAVTGSIKFYTFGCQAIWSITPIAVVFVVLCFRMIIQRKYKKDTSNTILIFAVMIHLLIILCHRTLGGWQFGNRYLVDMLPYIYCGVLSLIPEGTWVDRFILPICCEGAFVNLVGTIAMYNKWI